MAAKKIDPFVVEVLKRYDIDPNAALWDCHGTWVMYHKYVELVCAKAGVEFDMPQIIEFDTDKKRITMLVRGAMGDRKEWSFGEVSAANCKNAYPWAMAEKRAKDRVALKLVGLAGHVYSEEEMNSAGQDDAPPPNNRAKRDDPDAEAFKAAAEVLKLGFDGCNEPDELGDYWKEHLEQLKKLPQHLYDEVKAHASNRKRLLTAPAHPAE